MKKTLLKTWPILIILGVWFWFASPYFLKGLVPFPSTYQVTFFPPWSASYGMPVKNNAMPDIITQIYPWKKITIDAWKRGEVPLWNPYAFGGTVHAANYQSAVFSPFNLLFLFLPFIDAWSVLILLQPLIAGCCMYWCLRAFERSKVASLLGSIAYMFCGFMVVWMAYGTLGYAALWLPLGIGGLYLLSRTRKYRYGALTSLALALSLMSGHFQISLYVLGTLFLYGVFLSWTVKKPRFMIPVLLFLLVGLGLAAPQLLLTMKAYLASARSASFVRGEVIPWQYFITLFVPDFYGNPVTRNDWFGHYAEWASYFGSIPLVFALFGLAKDKTKHVRFWGAVALGGLLLAYPTPFNFLLFWLKLPVLSTSAASRIIIIVSFALVCVASYGVDALQLAWDKKKRKPFMFAILLAALYVGMLLTLKVVPLFPADKLAIAWRNAMLPSLFALIGIIVMVVGFYLPKKVRPFLLALVILVTAFDLVRYSSKWMPFDPRQYVFPDEKTATYLQKTVGIDRVFGNLGGEFGNYYSLPLIEGYDAMYSQRYGEFIGSASDGRVAVPGRSVVILDKYGVYTEKMLALLGVRYMAHRISDGRNVWAYPVWSYPNYRSIYRGEHYEVFENTAALPRAYLVSSYQVSKSDQAILDTLYADEFHPQDQVVLEQKPIVAPKQGDGQVQLGRYTANRLELTTRSRVPKLLVLSDVFDSGWHATVDGKTTPVYRANYDMRAVAIPAGNHTIRMWYWPWQLTVGIMIAVISVISLLVGAKQYAHRIL